MTKLLLAALILFSTQAQAATWESLTEKAMQEGTVSENNFGLTKFIERRTGSQIIYFTIDLDPQTGQARHYSAVVENWSQTPDGKFKIDQDLFWFTPVGELAVTARYQIELKADKSYESRKEIAYGESPEASDLSLWDAILKAW